MDLKNTFTKGRIWFDKVFSGKETRANVPRKKLEIQYHQTNEQFEEQVKLLERILNNPNLDESVKFVGWDLLQRISRFRDLHLIRVHQTRLKDLPISNVHPTDMSLWVLYYIYSLMEEIHHFVNTAQV